MTVKICEQCSEQFTLNPRVGLNWTEKTGRGRFCSDKCSRSARKGIRVAPATEFKRKYEVIISKCVCGEEFRTTEGRVQDGRGKYCSKVCYYSNRKWLTGSGSPNWKGGITPLNLAARMTPEYREWRKAVFERDNYTCQFCEQRGGFLHADHIKRFADYPELRLQLNNGRTLCKSCHRQTPTYGSRKIPA